jgi:transcriptional regulator NrdR family protein
MGRPHKCPYCKETTKSISKGVRKTKTLGIRRIRLCKDCGRKFTPRNQKQVFEEALMAKSERYPEVLDQGSIPGESSDLE